MSCSKSAYALFLVMSLSACQAGPSGTMAQHKERALAELAKLHTAPPAPAATVNFANAFHVPEVDHKLEQRPEWYGKEIKLIVDQLPLQQVLASIFPDAEVSLTYVQPELAELPVSINFRGYRGDLIQILARQLDVHVDMDEREVYWDRWQTAELDVAFIAGATEFFMGNRETRTPTANLNQGQAANQSPQRSSEQYSNFRNERLSVWDDLQRTLSMLISPKGLLSLNQSSTSVVVRDTPRHVRAVADYLRQQNERLTRQVAIEVQIIEVSFSDEQQVGVDWQALIESAGGGAVLGLGSGGVGQLTEELAGQLLWQRQEGRASGSQLFIQALQQQGMVRINNQPRVVSLNNQIAKIALQDNATYLASAGTTSTVNVGATTSLTPGVVTTGFELYLLPSIRRDEVILQLSTELSDLQRIDEVRSGEQLIQTPHTNRKQFFMQAVVGDGQTLLLSGLRNERSELQEQQSWLSLLLGGQQLEQQRHSETLVLLTPTLLHRDSRL